MSSRMYHEAMIHGPRRIIVEGSFAPDTANAPTDVKGLGFSVAYTSTGLFTITFQDAFVDLESFIPSLRLATGDDKIVQGGLWVAADRTIQVRVWDVSGAAVADIAADPDNRISFIAIFRDTGSR